jgi:hypothetical protein
MNCQESTVGLTRFYSRVRCRDILIDSLPERCKTLIDAKQSARILSHVSARCDVNHTRTKKKEIEAARTEFLGPAVTAACSVALRGGVIGAFVYMLLGLAPLLAVLAGFAQTPPASAGVEFEAGIEREDVDGDLKSAMDIYQKIAADASAPRDVRARALLRLAGCDEKLGRQARQIYEQILRDYADQPAAVQARSRLASLNRQEHPTPPTTMTVRKIERAGIGGMAESDTDGQRAVYKAGDNLYFGDLAGHSKQIVMKNLTSYGWIPSRDFSMVALDLLATSNRPHTLAVVKTNGTGYRELIRDDPGESVFGSNSSFSMSWSWDNRYLLLCDFSRRSHLSGQLWIVSVADGQRHVLADAGSGWMRRALFSPDGRFVTYEVFRGGSISNASSRVFVVPTQGGEPHLIYESAPWQVDTQFLAMEDWTADGRYIAIKDIRQGRYALYLLPIKNGAADGIPLFVRYGDGGDGYTTLAGALVYADSSTRLTDRDVNLGSVDQDGHLGNWRSLDIRAGVSDTLSFSPDGRQIAYTALDIDPARRDLIVRDLSTGKERVVYQTSYASLTCQYSARDPKIFCYFEKEDGKIYLISIAVDSGGVEQLASFSGFRFMFKPLFEDRYFFLGPAFYGFGNTPVAQWDRETQQETVVMPADEWRNGFPVIDGRLFIRFKDETLAVRPISGGDWRTLASGLKWQHIAPVATPDGNWVLYMDKDAAGKLGIFRVPAAGGPPQMIGIPPTEDYPGLLYFSPDGRQVLFLNAGSRNNDLWILENFEPSAKK